MTTMSGGGGNGGCEAAAAANGRREGGIHMNGTGRTYPACKMTIVSGHTEGAASVAQRSLWPHVSF